MMLVAKCLFTLFLALWLGETVFLSLVAAPVLFTGMASPQEAGAVMTLLFPWYYRLAYVCGLILLGSSIYIWRRSDAPKVAWLVAAGIAGVAFAASLYAGVVVQPRAHALREEARSAPKGSVAKVEFDRLHQLAVQLNGGVLLATLAIAGAAATRLR